MTKISEVISSETSTLRLVCLPEVYWGVPSGSAPIRRGGSRIRQKEKLKSHRNQAAIKGELSMACCCSVIQSCPTLWNPMDCSMPAFPTLHHLPDFAQTHIYWVNDAIWPSHPLSPPSPPPLVPPWCKEGRPLYPTCISLWLRTGPREGVFLGEGLRAFPGEWLSWALSAGNTPHSWGDDIAVLKGKSGQCITVLTNVTLSAARVIFFVSQVLQIVLPGFWTHTQLLSLKQQNLKLQLTICPCNCLFYVPPILG